MDLLFPILYKAFWIFVFLAVTIPLGEYVLKQVNPPKKILVLLDEGQGGENLVSRWQALLKPVSLQNFYEITTPDLPDVFSTKNKDVLEEFKLTFKGVEIHTLISNLRVLLEPPGYQVHISTVTEGKKSHLKMKLELGAKTLRAWYRSSEGVEGEDKAKEDKAKLEDFSLFQLLHFLYYDAAGPRTWRKSFQSPTPFPNPQAMAAYYGGLRQLDSYLQTRQQKELEGTISQFRLLRVAMPRFADGLMLLGLALAENREEEEAAKVFKLAAAQYTDALEKLQKIDPRPELEIFDTELNLCQILLWQATSYRKQYGAQSNHEAVRLLDDLITRMKQNRGVLKPDWDQFLQESPSSGEPPPVSNKIRLYLTYARLLSQAQCELADTLGSYAIYTKPYAPENWQKMFAPENTPAPMQSLVGLLPADGIAKLKALHRAALQEGKNFQEDLQGYWRLRPRGELERAELASQFLSVEGYVKYRLAAWTCPTDDAYRASCETAVTQLEEADATRPNQYMILQNLGTVLADPIYDAEGYKLGMARKYFEQSIQLKEKDYYGHEQLARITAREVELHGAEKPDKIDAGIKHAEEAIALRPWSGGAYASLAELKIMKYLLMTEPVKQKELTAGINHALDQARRLWPKSPRASWVRLNWEVAQFKTRAKDNNFAAEKKELLENKIAPLEQEFPVVDTPEVRFFRKKMLELKKKVEASTPGALPNL